MLAAHVLRPQRTGPQVFTQIFEPYLLILLVTGAAILALIARRRVPSLLLLALVVAVGLRYGPLLISFPAATPTGAQRLHVMSWNMEAGGVPFETMADTIEDAHPDIVGWSSWSRPYLARRRTTSDCTSSTRTRCYCPDQACPTLACSAVSRSPSRSSPKSQACCAPSSRHRWPAHHRVCRPPVPGVHRSDRLCAGHPDAQPRRGNQRYRDQIDAELAADHDVMVLGDFNTTEREPAYAELSKDLHDAQRQAGFGFGMSWRPAAIENLPFGLLRIDYVLASARFVALASAPDCTPRGSDHCLVTATFARPQTQQGSASGTLPEPVATGVPQLVARAPAVSSR
jgi:hypothetical protein